MTTSVSAHSLSPRLLICTDLDRTLLPNGAQPESVGARGALARLVSRPEIRLAFVSGRRRDLQRDAIAEFDLPIPDYGIADVGASIYRVVGDRWDLLPAWHDCLGESWGGRTAVDLAPLLADLSELRLQGTEAQGAFKLSYFAPAEVDSECLLREVRARLDRVGVAANLIWSVDETGPTGLLDVLPPVANKLKAIEFLMEQEGFQRDQVLYAGDSGNDLEVFVSGLPSVLVANATDAFRRTARAAVEQAGRGETFHLASGGHLGMNGNYAAGILEGIRHFHPEIALDLG